MAPSSEFMKALHARRRAERTHFKCGHAITPENTYTNPKGSATCRACKHKRPPGAPPKAPDPACVAAQRRPRSGPEYFEARSTLSAAGCRNWLGKPDGDGYGHTEMLGYHTTAHNARWVVANGPVPPGHTVDHLCRNRLCVELSHLEAVPHNLNVRRGSVARGEGTEMDTRLCPSGHPYDRVNTYGYKFCSVCHAAAKARCRETQTGG